jgi:drug/metabolite transporter (DMT)-like permease
MKQIIGIALLVVGVVLLFLAYDSYHSAASNVSRVVTGTSTDKTLWLAVGGVVGSALGLSSLFAPSKRA